ncbi:hypothetical protein [Vicingus serpentipes]|uniref:hypothetical protein n=1 Tax=Vicingus serpentipes TaxID=1926625 RepID=UPI001CB8F25D
MKVLFWLEKHRLNKRGEAALKLRITRHSQRINIATGISLLDIYLLTVLEL